MKALKTKVILSAFVLLFALVATIGSTFAWFTVSNEVKVDSFDLTIQTSDSLLIRVYGGEDADAAEDLLDLQDTTKYYTLLNKSLIEAKYTGFESFRLTPLTAVQFSLANDLSLATAPILNPFSLTNLSLDNANTARVHSAAGVAKNSTSGNFIELRFWVLSQSSTAKNLYLQNLEIKSDLVTFAANSLPGQINAAKAVRLGVGVNSGIGAAIDPTGPNFVYSNGHADSTTLYGFSFLSGQRGHSTNADLNALSAANKTALVAAHAKFATTGTAVAHESIAVPANSLVTAFAGTSVITELQPNIPQLITVRIYIEGWDAYATNAIVAAKFKINFSFVIPNTTA